MYKRLLFFLLVFQFQTAAAQLVKGAVSYYPKGPYQVTHEESLARIEINGGFDYKLKGFLNFEKDNINFAVGGEGKETSGKAGSLIIFQITTINWLRKEQEGQTLC